jgi:hypothetical protein
MTTKKTTPRSEPATTTPISETIPCTPEERLQRIEALGDRIAGYVRFMCELGTTVGTSAEAKERARAAFYERLLVVERQLGQIKEAFLLE